MNPITNMKNLNKMNDRELEMGLAGTKNSWHDQVNARFWVPRLEPEPCWVYFFQI